MIRHSRLRPHFKWALVATFVFAGLLTGTALSQEPSEKPPPVTNDPYEDSRTVNQRPLVEAADRLDAIAEEQGLNRFVGVRINHADRTVTLYWYGGRIKNEALGLEMDDIESGLGIPVIVRFTDYSVDELDAEARRIMDLDPSAINGVRVTAAGPSDHYGGLVISVEPLDLPLAEASIESDYPLRFEAMPTVEFIGRWDDVPPFWGGLGADGSGGRCTPNFSFFRPGGEEVLVFPIHCGAGNWQTITSDRFVGETSGTVDNATESRLLRLANYGPAVWAGTWGNGGTGRWVSGARNPADESFVTLSGSQSGAHAVKVKEVGQYINVPIGSGLTRRVGPGFWSVDQEGDGSAGQGDSGAPVMTSDSNGYMVARGMLDAVDPNRRASCEGVTGRTCSSRTFSVNIRAIMANWDLTIQQIQ